MSKIESLMLTLAQMLSFDPSHAEIRTAKSELELVSPETVEQLVCDLRTIYFSSANGEFLHLLRDLNRLMLSAINYRVKLPISQYRINAQGHCFYICPRCQSTLERDYQSYCDRCGQHLDWSERRRATLLFHKGQLSRCGSKISDGF